MRYKVEYTEKAVKALRKLDRSVLIMIKAWIDKNLDGCEDPRIHGKGLSGNRSHQWRYRAGDYRLLADILDDKLIIVMVEIGHRREIYKTK